MSRPFLKMNGLGNDFVVVEAGDAPFRPSPAQVRDWADRERGVGFDQLIGIARGEGDAPFVRFWNADGEEVAACGNGSRCVGWLLMQATGADTARFETLAGPLSAVRAGERRVTVNMGPPGLDWRDIPLAEEMDTTGIELAVGPPTAPILHTPGCVSMGNPHVVFFVDDAEAAPVEGVGPMIERHPLFPQGVNVGFLQVRSADQLRLRVWERGAGLTKACGTGACAALVAAHRRGKAARLADVEMDGGVLRVAWREADDYVLLTGDVAVDFTGVLPP